MSNWYRHHLDSSLKALVTFDRHRFFVNFREPEGEHREPISFYRSTLRDAQESADRIVQAYYPHECGTDSCDVWRKID
jgi:hypothetical protein